jgi:hypothetical protein
VRVSVSTLDEEVGDLVPSVVKIDVEGAELDVLRGGRALLTSARPTLILEHVASAAALYDASSAEVWDVLADYGYEVYSVTGDGPFTRDAFGSNELVVNWLGRPVR